MLVVFPLVHLVHLEKALSLVGVSFYMTSPLSSIQRSSSLQSSAVNIFLNHSFPSCFWSTFFSSPMLFKIVYLLKDVVLSSAISKAVGF